MLETTISSTEAFFPLASREEQAHHSGSNARAPAAAAAAATAAADAAPLTILPSPPFQVGVGPSGNRSQLARVAVVDGDGQTVYDK